MLRELPESERGDDGHDVRVVREIEIQGLIQREGTGLGVEGRVGLRGPWWKVVEVVCEPGTQFLDIAYSDCAAGGGAEATVAVEEQVDAVFEALPFREGEELAPFGVAVGDSFVGTEGLCLAVVLAVIKCIIDAIYLRCNCLPVSSCSCRRTC
jgi:hypothetical protein